jgi:hypothetical protein
MTLIIPAIVIRTADADDVEAGLAAVWKTEAVKRTFAGDADAFDAAPQVQRLRALLVASLVRHGSNVRAERAQRAAAVVPEPDVS